jgi:hypothetical protein
VARAGIEPATFRLSDGLVGTARGWVVATSMRTVPPAMIHRSHSEYDQAPVALGEFIGGGRIS